MDEDHTIGEGYALKLNSYDLGVDLELSDAIQRLRFEHPEVNTVVVTSDVDRVFKLLLADQASEPPRTGDIGPLTHIHEHLGQSIAYARSNGVVPPWSM